MDGLSQGTMTYGGAKSLCNGLNDDDESKVDLFEPRTLEEQSAVLQRLAPFITLSSLGGTPAKFWINAMRRGGGDSYIYNSDGATVPNTFWKPGQRTNNFVMMDSSDGKWKDVTFSTKGYTICQASIKRINPNCEDEKGMGKL